MAKRYRIVAVETWRRVYDIEADSRESAEAALRHVRPTPVEERCDRQMIVACAVFDNGKQVPDGAP